MSSKRSRSESKKSRCTFEGAGWPAVTVEIENPLNSQPPTKTKPTKRQKKAPKSIEFQVKGSLRSRNLGSLPDISEQEDDRGDTEECDGMFDDWMRGFDDVVSDIEHETGGKKDNSPQRKTPNFWLREWLLFHSDSYTQTMYDRESPPEDMRCDSCEAAADQLYRCTFCLGHCLSCASCLVKSHRFQPTHRPQLWNGSYWTNSSLADLGLVLNLGHRAMACSLNETPSKLLVGNIDGYTDIRVRYCQHPDAPSKSLQLLAAGLFPCSDRRPETAFTTHMLDLYDIFNTVGRTSGHKINSVMERATKPGFPDDVDDRYRELLTTYRKYLYVIKLRRAGHMFQPHPRLEAHPGDQAFDCVACPRPEFNFSMDEVPEDERGFFRAYYSYDGNFRMYRKNKKADAGDICFSDGLAYFPPKEPYKEWVATHPEPKKSEEKPTCDNHKAGKDNSVKSAGRDVTGVGAFTCTSHSCVAPRGMVDFFKGERQIYCDYAFASMYKYLTAHGLLPVGMTYDIWCHWRVNFDRRKKNLPPLYQIPDGMDLTGAIPKWHLLGHHRVCWILWSLDHKEFVGRMEGEGPERVWAHFNEHSGSTSEQGHGQRTDTVNNVACDWGFVKATEMHTTLPARFRDAKKSRNRELKNHEGTTSSLPAKKLREWEKESIEPVDLNNDGNWTTPLMDPVLAGGYHETLQEERENESKTARTAGRRGGAVRWVADGIELEHSVQRLKDEGEELGPNLTPRQANAINSKRIALRDRIDAFFEKRASYMPEIGEPDSPRLLEFGGEDGEWAEPVDLGLPSSYQMATLAEAGFSTLADLEMKLRRGTCTDALASVKRLLGGKAVAIKYKKTQLSGQIAITRAETAIQAHTKKIKKTRWRYLNSRSALLKLGPTEADLEKYEDLKVEHLVPLKSYFEEYAQSTGHGESTMPWIWRSSGAPNKSGDWEVDALKTEWFRSRERFKRWDEQLILVKREMIMSIRSFQSHQEVWEWKAQHGQLSPGMKAYACKRSAFFSELARRMFSACRIHLEDDVVGLKWAENWLKANVLGEQHGESVRAAKTEPVDISSRRCTLK